MIGPEYFPPIRGDRNPPRPDSPPRAPTVVIYKEMIPQIDLRGKCYGSFENR